MTVYVNGIKYSIDTNQFIAKVGDTSLTQENGWENPNNHPTSINIVSSVLYESRNYPVTAINDYAFFHTSGVTSISIPNGMQIIGRNAFDYSYIEVPELRIPDSVTFIGYHGFATNLISNVFIGTGLSTISDYGIFANNPPLMKIIVDERNTNFCNDDQFALYSKDKTVLYQATSFSKHFIIPATVKTIKCKAFDNFFTESIRTSRALSSFQEFSIHSMPNLKVIYLLSEVPSSPRNIIYNVPNLKYMYYYAKSPSSYVFTYGSPSLKKIYVFDPEFNIINGMSTTLHYYQYCFTCDINKPQQAYYNEIFYIIMTDFL